MGIGMNLWKTFVWDSGAGLAANLVKSGLTVASIAAVPFSGGGSLAGRAALSGAFAVLRGGAVKGAATVAAPVVAGAVVGAAPVAGPVAANVGLKTLGFAVKHPVIAGAVGLGVVGAANKATDGAVGDVARPVGGVVVSAVGSSVKYAASGAKDMVTGGPSADKAGGGEFSTGGAGLGAFVDGYKGKMAENGLYAAVPALMALNFAGGGNQSPLNRAFSAAAIGLVAMIAVKMAESYGVKLPGLSGMFNMAAANDSGPVAAPEPAPVLDNAAAQKPVPVAQNRTLSI